MPPVPKPRSSKKGGNRNLVLAVGAACAVAAALIAGSILFTRGGDKNNAPSTSTNATDVLALVTGIPQAGTVLGDPTAKVTMAQYEDLQCPICKRYTDDAFPAIVTEYVRTGRIKLNFRGLAFIGPDSEKALRIALAAGRQNRLWQVVELFYAKQGQENSGWVTDGLIDEVLAEVPGLDAAKVKADATSAAVTKEIAAIGAEAQTRNVQGTPSFFIGIGVNQPYQIQVNLTPEAFRPALNDALKG